MLTTVSNLPSLCQRTTLLFGPFVVMQFHVDRLSCHLCHWVCQCELSWNFCIKILLSHYLLEWILRSKSTFLWQNHCFWNDDHKIELIYWYSFERNHRRNDPLLNVIWSNNDDEGKNILFNRKWMLRVIDFDNDLAITSSPKKIEMHQSHLWDYIYRFCNSQNSIEQLTS